MKEKKVALIIWILISILAMLIVVIKAVGKRKEYILAIILSMLVAVKCYFS